MLTEQQTLSRKISISGVGLHTGGASRLEIRPAEAGSGFVFVREGLRLFARMDSVVASDRSTTLGDDEWRITTVEHLLAALWGMGVDNAEIAIEGEEIPILDGSALPFAEEIATAGLVGVGEPRRMLVVREPFTLRHGESSLAVTPCDGFRITYQADYGRPHAGPQEADFWLEPEVFAREIAPARTFGFHEEVEALRSRGLALGGSLDNALVISDDGPSSPFRFPNELARHKLLDIIGDLALCGRRPLGHFVGCKSGHYLNTQMARRLVETIPQ